MVSNSDIQLWQDAVNGINATGKQDLTQAEWQALIAMNGILGSDNIQTIESRFALLTIKDNLRQHDNNFILQKHLQNFVTLYEKYNEVRSENQQTVRKGRNSPQSRKNFLLYGILLIFIAIASIKIVSIINGQISTVYVTGTERINGEYYITLWKNGSAQRFSTGAKYIVMQSAFVSGNDVYATGSESLDNKNFATLWKNGIPQRLTKEGVEYDQGGAMSVHVENNTVYVAGRTQDQSRSTYATLWENNIPRLLTDSYNSSAYSVVAHNSSVYVVGTEMIRDRRHPYNKHIERLYNEVNNASVEIYIEDGVTVWENNVKQSLTDGIDGFIEDLITESIESWIDSGKRGYYNIKLNCSFYPGCVYVSDKGNVYVTASFYIDSKNYATFLWENGKMKYRIEENFNAQSIFVKGNDIYIAGSGSIAKIWENGKVTLLGNNSSFAHFVTCINNKVYVAGHELVNGARVATLWTKNGANYETHYLSTNPGEAFYVCR